MPEGFRLRETSQQERRLWHNSTYILKYLSVHTCLCTEEWRLGVAEVARMRHGTLEEFRGKLAGRVFPLLPRGSQKLNIDVRSSCKCLFLLSHFSSTFFYLYDISRISKSIDPESRIEVTIDQQKEKIDCFNEGKVSIWDEEKYFRWLVG